MTTKKILFFFISLLIFGCTLNEDGTLRDSEGNIFSASETEIVESQRTLLHDQVPKNLPASADGGVLFDGKVVSVIINPNGLYATTFEVHKVLFGDLEGKERIIIYSPSPENTGIDFREGGKYRVFSVDLNGAYRTWDWLGTVKLDD